MALTQFAMIIKGPGYDPALHHASILSPVFSTTVVCVSSFEQAIPVAKELVQQGIQLIELCGGFTPEQASSIHDSIDKQIPVGGVRYSSDEQRQLALLFGKPAPTSA
jgi:hypothetical protein